MRRLSLPLCAALAAIPAFAALAPDQLFSLVSPTVWRVSTSDASGQTLATGSSVVTAPGTLVTNCHVLKGAASLKVTQGTQSYQARLVHADAERDLCEIAVPEIKVTPAKLASEPARIGQRIYTIGSPRGFDATLSDGLVSGLRRDPAGQLVYIQISAPISPGSSGGGLFDESGRLLGITSAGVAGVAQNLNFARPASQIPEIPARAIAALEQWHESQATVASVESNGTSSVRRRTLADPVPFIGDERQLEFREKFLAKKPPRAFAISEDGHLGWANGNQPKRPDLPTNPVDRALLYCANTGASKPCVLYVVDNDVVYESPKADRRKAPDKMGSPTD